MGAKFADALLKIKSRHYKVPSLNDMSGYDAKPLTCM